MRRVVGARVGALESLPGFQRMIRTLLLATLPNQDHLCAGRNAILHAVAAELSQINIYLATGSAPDFSPAGVKTVR
jgi:hypothetical protein